ncbi:reverse transcriptase-like protein [Candidatus Parcubacteria bacterium]|nr:MAG: reverse transcriptase-like protein [Candidatus Parcubacteria bacterium]
MKAIIHTDGGARGNPGPAGAAAIVEIGGKSLNYGLFIGRATNNQAEYQAIILGLTKAKELGATEADCFLDSELVVKQLNQEYKVKNNDLAPLFVRVWNLKIEFYKIRFFHIPREENKNADRLVNKVIDENI